MNHTTQKFTIAEASAHPNFGLMTVADLEVSEVMIKALVESATPVLFNASPFATEATRA